MRARPACVLLASAAMCLTSCGGGAKAGGAVVIPESFQPEPPSSYRPPADALRVSTARELRRALARHRRRAIVLAPGRYDTRRPFLNPGGNRIYAANRGRSVLGAGIAMGGEHGPGGGLLRGLVIDVRRRSRAADGALVSVWGSGRGTRIEDTVLRGHGVIASGVLAREPAGLVVRRVRATGFTDYGVLADANEPDRGILSRPAVLEDLRVRGVHRAVSGSSDGRAEACVWVGNTARVARVLVRDCGVTGLWTGTATRDARISKLDVDDTPVGVYLEHTTRDSRFSALDVGRRVRIGVVAEWADPSSGGPASIDNVIERSRFLSSRVGVYLDAGTTRTTVRASRFSGQSWAAIGDYEGVGNEIYGNDYRGAAEGVRRDHLDGG
jgi:hypothetical protein